MNDVFGAVPRTPELTVAEYLLLLDNSDWESVTSDHVDYAICTFAMFIDGTRYAYESEIPSEVWNARIKQITIAPELIDDNLPVMRIETDHKAL